MENKVITLETDNIQTGDRVFIEGLSGIVSFVQDDDISVEVERYKAIATYIYPRNSFEPQRCFRIKLA